MFTAVFKAIETPPTKPGIPILRDWTAREEPCAVFLVALIHLIYRSVTTS